MFFFHIELFNSIIQKAGLFNLQCTYPEHLKNEYFLYDDETELYEKMKVLLLENSFAENAVFSDWAKGYDWQKCIADYNQKLENVITFFKSSEAKITLG